MRRQALLYLSLVVFLAIFGMAGCSSRPKADRGRTSDPRSDLAGYDTGRPGSIGPGGAIAASGNGSAPAAAPAANAPAEAERSALPAIVALGDSLTAGYGLRLEEAYPALLEVELARRGYHYRVFNAGISGDTTAQGLSRIEVVLRQKPEVVIVSLGGNDGLRGQPIARMRENLAAIIERLQEAGVKVVLAGIQIPPNYGPDYTQEFRESFPALAERYKIPLIPFILEGVAAKPELNLPDGIHPTAEGHKILLQNVLPVILPLLTN